MVMVILEFKAYGRAEQFVALDEAIRVTQFIRNKALRYWMDNRGVSKYDLNKQCAVLAAEYDFADRLNSQARQAAAERAWSAVARFYDNCKKKVKGKKGYPQFKKNVRSVEYKTTGWRLSEDRKSITFTDKCGIGRLKMKGTRDLLFYHPTLIKRVRLVKKADGYYIQFVVDADRREPLEATGKTLGLDVGLQDFYTDSAGHKEPNPHFLRKAEKQTKKLQRRVSKKVKGSNNRRKAVKRLARKHLKIQRQRKDHAIKLARCVIQSADLVAYEDLRIRNMVKNHSLAKFISDASWYQFRTWLEYFGKVYGRITVPVPPQYTSQACSECGSKVEKTLSTRTHRCPHCGYVADRDKNAARNILTLGIHTAGQAGIYAWGDSASTESGETANSASAVAEPRIQRL
ncbi:transposase, IS605 OrfB family [Deinococcus aerius]|uniref:Transposase, IS605 OrfB family n=2 Tax=Deinococcus aerius TaxID=200253 RepID=A0A2I9D5N0_9DEIO|nr:transposase, IS605 OrfB family [Deinococcus aerius]